MNEFTDLLKDDGYEPDPTKLPECKETEDNDAAIFIHQQPEPEID